MIIDIYRGYFQKSRAFLYPLLNIRSTNTINPINTYLSWTNNGISKNDYKLIVSFLDQNSDGYKAFERQILLKNQYFLDVIQCKNKVISYIFTFENNKEDWNYFLEGKYSKLSNSLKDSIKRYYGSQTNEWELMHSYVDPDKHYSVYADILTVDKRDIPSMTKALKKAGELCVKYDEQKEDCRELILNTVYE